MARLRIRNITEKDEIGFFAPKRWEFWRCLIVCFCLFSIVGHWLELLYCIIMDALFGIVEPDYAIWIDPWYHPYWVYGIGAVIMTLIVEPLKEHIIVRRKTLWGALLESFVLVVVLAMLMELIIGWIINQPDASGEYPYWDNSQLPLNVFGQAWLVNDFFIGFAAMLYVWLLYPLVCEGFDRLRPRVANVVFVVLVLAFAVCCIISYTHLVLFTW